MEDSNETFSSRAWLTSMHDRNAHRFLYSVFRLRHFSLLLRVQGRGARNKVQEYGAVGGVGVTRVLLHVCTSSLLLFYLQVASFLFAAEDLG